MFFLAEAVQTVIDSSCVSFVHKISGGAYI